MRQRIGLGPDDLPFHIQRVIFLLGPNLFNTRDFDLADLEDLYYAVGGKIKDLLQCANIHLANGFTKLDEPYIYFGDVGVTGVGPITLKDFISTWRAKEAVLWSSEVSVPLNEAILQKNMFNILRRPSSRHNIRPVWDPIQRSLKIGPIVRQGAHIGTKTAYQANATYEVQGLLDLREMSCAMIFAGLSEKYREIVSREAEEAARRRRSAQVRSFQRVQRHRNDALRKLCGEPNFGKDNPQLARRGEAQEPHVNRHDMTSRLKRLEDPCGPEYPCICDTDCICAPLCAGEPGENCLCETNSLFWRVTTEFEIEELLHRVQEERSLLVGIDGGFCEGLHGVGRLPDWSMSS